MRGFIGKNGRAYSDGQRKALFYKLMHGEYHPHIDYRALSELDSRSKSVNRFVVGVDDAAVGLSLAGAGVVGVGGVGESVGVPLVAAVAAPVAIPVGVEALKYAGETINRPVLKKGEADYIEKGISDRAKNMAMPVVDTAGAVASSVVSGSDLGEPYVHSFDMPGLIAESYYSRKNYLDSVSRDDDSNYIDIEKVRALVKKQYPYGNIDAKIKLLSPDKYMKTALSDNPGREMEAITSNGFYSPTKDTAYLEKDGNKLNTLRAMIHEMVHNMSDDGVNDDGDKSKYMLNEGYADYVAKEIMVQEMKIPERVADRTIGYQKEMKAVEEMVRMNGRRKVDDAFLVNHSLDGLKTDFLEAS
jgi:hypothetical protein